MNDDRTDGERSCDPGAEIDMPGEIDHADPRVADGVDTGTAFGMCGTAGVNTGAAVRPDPNARICASRRRPIHSRLTPRPRVLPPAAAMRDQRARRKLRFVLKR
jgi:hypothetical protein